MRKYGKLLLVEDDKELAPILANALAPNFENVLYTSNGAEAMELIEQHTFSVILTDYNMPKMSGDQLLRKMRSQGDLTPVIFLTGGATIELCLSALRLGVGDVLEKPVSPEELLVSIDRVLEIEKRKQIFYSSVGFSIEQKEKAQKMIGLLHVVNEKKKGA
jgi:DNA-binding NtrC family response regulator